jgi:hypothetical protein
MADEFHLGYPLNNQALAQALRSADFAATRSAADDYERSIHAELDVTIDPDRRAAIYQEALETLRNHLHLARVLRAHLAAQVHENAGSCLYAASEEDRHCWQFQA